MAALPSSQETDLLATLSALGDRDEITDPTILRLLQLPEQLKVVKTYEELKMLISRISVEDCHRMNSSLFDGLYMMDHQELLTDPVLKTVEEKKSTGRERLKYKKELTTSEQQTEAHLAATTGKRGKDLRRAMMKVRAGCAPPSWLPNQSPPSDFFRGGLALLRILQKCNRPGRYLPALDYLFSKIPGASFAMLEDYLQETAFCPELFAFILRHVESVGEVTLIWVIQEGHPESLRLLLAQIPLELEVVLDSILGLWQMDLPETIKLEKTKIVIDRYGVFQTLPLELYGSFLTEPFWRLLFSANPKLDPNLDGGDLFGIVCCTAELSVVRLFLDEGADPRGSGRVAPLLKVCNREFSGIPEEKWEAKFAERLQVVKLLVERGAMLTGDAEAQGAIVSEDESLFRYLVSIGLDMAAHGAGLLEHLCDFHEDATTLGRWVQILLDYGARVTTPALVAVMRTEAFPVETPLDNNDPRESNDPRGWLVTGTRLMLQHRPPGLDPADALLQFEQDLVQPEEIKGRLEIYKVFADLGGVDFTRPELARTYAFIQQHSSS